MVLVRRELHEINTNERSVIRYRGSAVTSSWPLLTKWACTEPVRVTPNRFNRCNRLDAASVEQCHDRKPSIRDLTTEWSTGPAPSLQYACSSPGTKSAPHLWSTR